MGKKSKMKSTQSHEVNVGVKRKISNEKESPAAKRQKEKESYPGRYVLLKRPGDLEISSDVASTSKKLKNEEGKNENGAARKTLKPTSNEGATGESIVNGSPKKTKKPKVSDSQLKRIFDTNSEDNNEADWSGSCEDDYETMSDEDDYDSMSQEDSEQWSTDTDYSMDGDDEADEASFHESDCESVCDEDFWNQGSSNDSDYIPDIEDRFIKLGEAVLYNAKGLDLAFGNSKESQIIDVKDITPAVVEGAEEEIPDLVNLNGELVEKEEDTMPTSRPIHEKEVPDEVLECNHLAEYCTFYDCRDDQGVIVKLSGTVNFHGILVIRAITNSVQINGYVLQPEEVVTASSISRGDYFLNLTPIINRAHPKEKLLDELMTLLSDQESSNVINQYNPENEAIIHLQHGIPGSTLEMLKNYSPYALLPSKKMILANSPSPSSELILSAKFFIASENKKMNTFAVNDQWSNLKVQAETRLVVIGGKNVGKSALTQFLINKNITSFKSILLIDLDIGQPICGPAQTVSVSLLKKPIIGPGYLSNNQPDKCLMYGDKSIMISPFKYVRCVRKLLQFCANNDSYKNIPWVINTMGYQKGFGLQLMCLLIRILQPTDVVQIQHGNFSFNFAKIITEDVVNQFQLTFFDPDDVDGIAENAFFTTHIIDSIVHNQANDIGSAWISNATEKRKLSMIAQLAKLLKGNHTCLNDVTPFIAPVDKIQLVVMDEEYMQLEQPGNAIMDLLNGNLVYLCHSDGQDSLDSTSILDCYGIGIVRGIDSINKQMYLLLPQIDDIDKLQSQINVLAIGNIPLPAEVVLKQSYKIAGNIPHVTCFKDRNVTSNKYVNKRSIKDCF